MARRGHSAASSRSGVGSFVFFGLIGLAVAVAGIVGVTVWGPEKTVKNRSQLATNPPASVELPSLPPDTPPAESAPPAVAASSSAPAPSSTPAKRQRAPKRP